MMQTAQYFRSDYRTARKAFLDAARIAGADVESFQNTIHSTSGDELFTDMALIGRCDADKAIVLISGTHGVEGFAGSGVQFGLLSEGVLRNLEPDVKIIMIHALNPYGFAEIRRFNEDNVDLNRNFIDHSMPAPKNDEYDRLATAIAPRSNSFISTLSAHARISWYRLCKGRSRLQHAVTHGQYSEPQGLFYGGQFATWSNQLLRSLTQRHLSSCSRVVAIDLHTGLGSYGKGEIIVDSPVGSPMFEDAIDLWGPDRVKSTVHGGSVSSHLVGTINQAFVEMLPEAKVTAVGLEFGTLPPMAVFRALRAENWLHHHAEQGCPATDRIKKRLLRAFYPEDDVWKEGVMEQGRKVVERVLRVGD